MPSDPMQQWHHAERLLQAGRFADAVDAYRALLAVSDWALPAHLRLSMATAQLGQVRASVAHALDAWAQASAEQDTALLEGVCRQLFSQGELQAGLACAALPALAEAPDAATQLGMAALLADFSFTDAALDRLERAQRLGADTADLHYQRASALAYAGDEAGAEQALAACLQRAPGMLPALRVRAKLRRATPDRNQLETLCQAAADTPDTHPDAPALHYALFKELDDLGDTDAAWAALDTGMRLRRRQVTHDPAAEAALFQHLHGVGPVAGEGAHDEGPVPIFIVGLPRSGTTLLERMLGAHPQVADAGELRDFTTQLRWLTDCMGGPHLDLALARAAEGVDMAELGRRYLAHTQWWAGGRSHYTDKLPTNFLNVGYIAKALPQARILHMRREAMDSCFSNLKELFADAYPHSYDQREMANHYRHYHGLMAHWHQAFHGRVLDVHYEQLVAAPDTVAREVLAFCGLPWESSVVAPEARRGAVATASAAQVREPIHTRFVGQWKRYEAHLQPLRDQLGDLAD